MSYDCWTEEDLLARQNKKARQVAEALALAVPLATVLLRYFEWNVDKLYAQYLRQPDQVLQAAGVRVAPVATPQAHASCLICDEPPSAVRVEKFLSCGHTVVRPPPPRAHALFLVSSRAGRSAWSAGCSTSR